jgi:diguanylate cyclase (GGDEF)-like protein
VIAILADALVLLGAVFLAASLVPVWKLDSTVTRGEMRRRWQLFTALILLFISGYAGYAMLHWGGSHTLQDLGVPVIFFFGGCFVLMANYFLLQTAYDVLRIAALEQENVTDPLMGIYNRRYLDRRLHEEVTRSQRYELPLAILMIDVDHFKYVNDTFGHPCGDRVLTRLAQEVINAVRVSDLVARYGGEEILVIAPNTRLDEVMIVAERIRGLVEKVVLTPLVVKEGLPSSLHVTVSIGVATLGLTAHNVESLINCADEALYHAKSEGRNRIVIYDKCVFGAKIGIPDLKSIGAQVPSAA